MSINTLYFYKKKKKSSLKFFVLPSQVYFLKKFTKLNVLMPAFFIVITNFKNMYEKEVLFGRCK